MTTMPVTEGGEEDDTIDVLQDLLDTVRLYEELERQKSSSAAEWSSQEEIREQITEDPDEDYDTRKTIPPCSHKTLPTLQADLQIEAGVKNLNVPEWVISWSSQESDSSSTAQETNRIVDFTVESYHGLTNSLLDKFGSVRYSSGVTYQGQFSNRKLPHGIGRLLLSDGAIFDGEIVDGQIGSRGIYTWPDGSVYEGALQDGLRNGYGRFLHRPSKNFYAGEWLSSKMHGFGKMVYAGDSTNVYRGYWHQDLPWGDGIRQWPCGNTYNGQWAQGLPSGRGEQLWRKEMMLYRGEFRCGKPDGYGVIVWLAKQPPESFSQRYYYGYFVSGCINGYGTLNEQDATRYEGTWKHGKKNGKFTVALPNGITLRCRFSNDAIDNPMPRFLFKEVSNEQYAWALPGPTVQQLQLPAFIHNNNRCALVLPGTLRCLTKNGFAADIITAEMKGLGTIIVKYWPQIKRVMTVYSKLTAEWACQENYTLRVIQYWQLVLDVGVEKTNTDCPAQQGLFTLIEEIEKSFPRVKRFGVLSHPCVPITETEIIDRIVVLAYIVEREKKFLTHLRSKASKKLLNTVSDEHIELNHNSKPENPVKRAWLIPGEPLKNFMERRLLKKAGLFKGTLFDDPAKSAVLFRYVADLFHLYKYIYEFYGGQDKEMPSALTLRLVLEGLQHAHILGLPGLSSTDVLKIFQSGYPELRGNTGSIALEIPLTFIEFMQLLVSLAISYNGPLQKQPEAVSLLVGRDRSGVYGKIAEAVDSVLLTKEKRPQLGKDDGFVRRNFDVAFFKILRQGADNAELLSPISNEEVETVPADIDLGELHPIADWYKRVTGFLEEILFPNMVVLKQTNDYLIGHGHAKLLGTRADKPLVAEKTYEFRHENNRTDSGNHSERQPVEQIVQDLIYKHLVDEKTEIC